MLDRPESWNAKMLNGKPLITDKQFKKLLASGTLRKSGESFLLSDIVRSRLVFGDGDDEALKPERDMYIKLDQPISHYMRDKSDW